jgi:hypothetical protein
MFFSKTHYSVFKNLFTLINLLHNCHRLTNSRALSLNLGQGTVYPNQDFAYEDDSFLHVAPCRVVQTGRRSIIALMMEAVSASVNFYKNTRRNISEDSLHIRRR